jgi:putative N6-adenine-specific DNA methylase
VPLVESPVNRREDLYELAMTVPWEEHLRHGGTLAVTVAARSEVFSHSRFAAQVVKDAVVDRIRAKRRERPSVDLKKPDLAIHLHIHGGRAALALDAAGEPLSHRGYRPRGGPAPLNEALAAGLLLLAGYDGETPLLDPMGGTGTFAAEAALIATRTPPGLRRRFAFERWIDHNRKVFEGVRRDLEAKRREAPQAIVATDHDPKAIHAARRNVEAAGMQQWVDIRHGEATMMEPPGEGALIVINPPYGHRLGDESALRSLYQGLGDRLKVVGSGCTAWILAGNRELAKSIGLRASRRLQVFNGPLECRWMRFDLYSGSRKVKYLDEGSKQSGD